MLGDNGSMCVHCWDRAGVSTNSPCLHQGLERAMLGREGTATKDSSREVPKVPQPHNARNAEM